MRFRGSVGISPPMANPQYRGRHFLLLAGCAAALGSARRVSIRARSSPDGVGTHTDGLGTSASLLARGGMEVVEKKYATSVPKGGGKGGRWHKESIAFLSDRAEHANDEVLPRVVYGRKNSETIRRDTSGISARRPLFWSTRSQKESTRKPGYSVSPGDPPPLTLPPAMNISNLLERRATGEKQKEVKEQGALASKGMGKGTGGKGDGSWHKMITQSQTARSLKGGKGSSEAIPSRGSFSSRIKKEGGGLELRNGINQGPSAARDFTTHNESLTTPIKSIVAGLDKEDEESETKDKERETLEAQVARYEVEEEASLPQGLNQVESHSNGSLAERGPVEDSPPKNPKGRGRGEGNSGSPRGFW